MTSTATTAFGSYEAPSTEQSLRSAIPQNTGADALLTYAVLVHPDPLQVSTRGRMTIVVSNFGSQLVMVESIAIALPIGTSAKALTSSATGISPAVPKDWDVQTVGGLLTFKPLSEAARQVGATGLAFQISNIAVNAQPGTCAIQVTETASSKTQPSASRTAQLAVPKFPEQFQVSDLLANPLDVEYGGSTTLNWNGTGTDATYTLVYQPAKQGDPVSAPVGNTGPYVAKNLRRKEAVHFTLVVEVKVPGEDRPLVVHRPATVTIETLDLEMSVVPPVVPPNGLACVQWESANATSCTLDPGGIAVPKIGAMWVIVTPTANTFTVTARGKGGASKQDQKTVTVDATMQPTEAGYVITGAAGKSGDWLNPFPATGAPPTPPTPGARGGDAVYRGALPPLPGSGTAARVIPLRLFGGPGGQGSGFRYYQRYGFVVGPGPGGDGGDAIIDAWFDESLPPAQYIVALTPGAGGAGGVGRPAAPPGRAGTTSIRLALPDAPEQMQPMLATAAPSEAEVPEEQITPALVFASAVEQDPGSDALLTYSALLTPDPLQVNAAGRITLVVSNSGSKIVKVQRIVVAIPVGTTAKTLTRSAAALEIRKPEGWDADHAGGAITLTPATPSAGSIGAAGVTFELAGFVVNAEPGSCAVVVTETASSDVQPAGARTARLTVPKFPEQFTVGELRATPIDVASGGSTTLDWSGTATDASYRLDYQPADGGAPVSEAVGNTGPYVARNLTRHDAVHFVLTVRAKVPGQDQPLIVQRHALVTVESLSLTVSIAPLAVAPNGLALLRWQADNATSCTLEPSGVPLATSGEMYVVVTAASNTFTVVAKGNGGASVQQQRTVTVDPTITPTEQGYVITGGGGGNGKWASCVRMGYISAQPGGKGGDAIVKGTIPPLQETGRPTRVIPIVLQGGPGGQGGNGTYCLDIKNPDRALRVPPAAGGNGGDAGVDATIDPSLPPAQFIVRLTPGTGGAGGSWEKPGRPGQSGTTFIRIARPAP